MENKNEGVQSPIIPYKNVEWSLMFVICPHRHDIRLDDDFQVSVPESSKFIQCSIF